MSRWTRVGERGAAELAAWLAGRESHACGFSWRAFGRPSASPRLQRGLAVLADLADPDAAGAVLVSESGFCIPVFDAAPGPASARELARSLPGWALPPSSCAGRAADVAAFEDAIRHRPALSVRYATMRLDRGAIDLLPAPTPGGLELREAMPADLEALLPIQAAYELEEVVTPLHRFDPRASRAGLARSLAEQRVVAVFDGGRAVAKAQTNARGSRFEQVGGVFVEPGLRGRGLGRTAMLALLSRIGGGGRSATLFVKEGNAPARALYLGLGFREEGPYRIDYWAP